MTNPTPRAAPPRSSQLLAVAFFTAFSALALAIVLDREEKLSNALKELAEAQELVRELESVYLNKNELREETTCQLDK